MTYQNTSEQFAARMPASGQTNSTAPFLTARGAWAQLGKMLSAIGTGIMNMSAASSRYNRVAALQAKSDAELAQMGITRDQIVHHVFRDLYYL